MHVLVCMTRSSTINCSLHGWWGGYRCTCCMYIMMMGLTADTYVAALELSSDQGTKARSPCTVNEQGVATVRKQTSTYSV